MKLFNLELDDSFYPISRKLVFKLFGLSIWSRSYVLNAKNVLNIYWESESGHILKLK